jgi:hypothetical protein
MRTTNNTYILLLKGFVHTLLNCSVSFPNTIISPNKDNPLRVFFLFSPQFLNYLYIKNVQTERRIQIFHNHGARVSTPTYKSGLWYKTHRR